MRINSNKVLRLSFSAMMMLFVFSTTVAQAIVTDRPDQTESSSTVPKGSLQIESGILLGFEENEIVSTKQLLAPTNLFRVGLTNGIELRILSQYESIKNQRTGFSVDGISDLEIGTKIQLLKKEDVSTEIAFLSHLIVPTGSKRLTNNNYGTINKLSISHPLSENIGLGYNIGYNYFGDGGNGDLTYSIALGISLTDKVAVYIEPYGDFTEFEDHVANFDAGFAYLVHDNLQLDFSFGMGINHTMNYISAGFSWLIQKSE